MCRFTRTSGNISHQHAQLLSGYGGVKLTTRRRSSQVRWSIGGRRSDVGHPKAFLTGHYGTLVVAGATGFRTNTSQKQNTRSTTPLTEAYLPGHRYRDTLKQHPRVSGERNFRGTAAETRKRASNPPSRHGSGCALSATGNRLGRTQTPTAATSSVCDHLPTEQLPVPCKEALQGAGAVPGDLKAPG